MVNLLNDGSAQPSVFTLKEKSIAAVVNYTFTFTHVTSGEVIAFDIAASSDTSTNKDRYNLFDLGSYFDGKEPGQWKYLVIDKERLTELETGSMTLTGANVDLTGHEINLTISGYNGE